MALKYFYLSEVLNAAFLLCTLAVKCFYCAVFVLLLKDKIFLNALEDSCTEKPKTSHMFTILNPPCTLSLKWYSTHNLLFSYEPLQHLWGCETYSFTWTQSEFEISQNLWSLIWVKTLRSWSYNKKNPLFYVSVVALVKMRPLLIIWKTREMWMHPSWPPFPYMLCCSKTKSRDFHLCCRCWVITPASEGSVMSTSLVFGSFVKRTEASFVLGGQPHFDYTDHIDDIREVDWAAEKCRTFKTFYFLSQKLGHH